MATIVTALQVNPTNLFGFIPAFRVDEVVTTDGSFTSATPVALFFDGGRAAGYAQSVPAKSEEN